jgi:hypothetical protein
MPTTGKRFKICKKCDLKKALSLFYRHKHSPLGRESTCKECRNNDPVRKAKVKVQYRKHREKHLEQKRQNYHENKEKHKKRQRRQYLKHRSKRLQDAAVYRFENKEKISEGQKKWYHKNKDTKIEKDTKYKRKRRKVDVNHNLIIILRDRLSKAISGDYKKGSAVSDLGCSIDELEKENRKLKEELEIAQKDIRDFEVLAIEWKKGHSDLERKHRIEVGNLEQTICELVKELRD